MQSFAETEFQTANFGDKRLKDRLIKIASELVRHPHKSFPQLYKNSWSDLKGCYRFFDNDKVTPELILEPHQASTVNRIQQNDIVLLAHDTTSINLSNLKNLEDLGYLERYNIRGIKQHNTLAISEAGLPLGIIYQQMWTRDIQDYGKRHSRHQRRAKEKESYKWNIGRERSNALIGEDVLKIHLADREGDTYEFLSMSGFKNDKYIVRLMHNRKLYGEDKRIKEYLSGIKPCGRYKISISRANRRKARTAEVEVKYSKLTINPPSAIKHSDAIEATVIYVYERNIKKVANPVRWYLLTSLSVESFDDAVRCIEYYSKRWLVERLHYVLKSGCRIETLQLRDLSRLMKAIVLYTIISWQILWLQYYARISGDLSYKYVLSEEQMQLLRIYINPEAGSLPEREPTVKDIVLWLSILGGYTNRSSDGPPGVKSLWRGYSIFLEVLYFFEKVKKNDVFKNKLMGNA